VQLGDAQQEFRARTWHPNRFANIPETQMANGIKPYVESLEV